MLNFPIEISTNNKANFRELNKTRLLSLLRNDIYNLIISRDDENEYYALDIFELTYNCKSFTNELITQTIEELNKLGWKTKLSFGDTGLFIYSTDEPPRSCW
jgi:hypothetical protein